MSDEMSDSGVKPWTVRGVGPEERNAAAKAAKRGGVPVGDWLARAIRTAVQAESQSDKAPVIVGQTAPSGPTGLDTAERIATALTGLAAAGLPVSRSQTARVAAALLRELPPSRRAAERGKAE